MQILGLFGMYFDAVVVEVEKSLLFFRLALAILCLNTCLVFSQVQKEASLSVANSGLLAGKSIVDNLK